MSRPTFVTPLTVQDYAARDASNSIQRRSSRQQQPASKASQARKIGHHNETSSSNRTDQAHAPAVLTNVEAPTATGQERQHSAAERRYRDNVHKCFQRLRQCLALHGLLESDECHDNTDEEGRNANARKALVLSTATKAINELQEHEREQGELILHLERHVKAACSSLQEAKFGGVENQNQSDISASFRISRHSSLASELTSSGGDSGNYTNSAPSFSEAESEFEFEDEDEDSRDTVQIDWFV